MSFVFLFFFSSHVKVLTSFWPVPMSLHLGTHIQWHLTLLNVCSQPVFSFTEGCGVVRDRRHFLLYCQHHRGSEFSHLSVTGVEVWHGPKEHFSPFIMWICLSSLGVLSLGLCCHLVNKTSKSVEYLWPFYYCDPEITDKKILHKGCF